MYQVKFKVGFTHHYSSDRKMTYYSVLIDNRNTFWMNIKAEPGNRYFPFIHTPEEYSINGSNFYGGLQKTLKDAKKFIVNWVNHPDNKKFIDEKILYR